MLLNKELIVFGTDASHLRMETEEMYFSCRVLNRMVWSMNYPTKEHPTQYRRFCSTPKSSTKELWRAAEHAEETFARSVAVWRRQGQRYLLLHNRVLLFVYNGQRDTLWQFGIYLLWFTAAGTTSESGKKEF